MVEIHPEDWFRFVQIDPFPKLWSRLQLTDDDLRALEIEIMASPRRPPVISGTRGLRKLRFASGHQGRGKRSSYRVFYTYFQDYGTILLMAVIGKTERSDLTIADKRALSEVIGKIEERLSKGTIR